MSSLWFVGYNDSKECNSDGPQQELTLCEWSESMTVLGITVGYSRNIYAIKSKRDEVLCYGFIRESQSHFPFKKNPFYIIPDQVAVICLMYLMHFKEYWESGKSKNQKDELPLSRVEGMDNVLKVKIGIFGESTLWIKYDGSLYVNGLNFYGELGMPDGDLIDGYIPTLSAFTQQHPKLKVVDAASSDTFSVVVADDGSAWFAGKMENLEANLESKGVFIPLSMEGDHHIVCVALGEKHMLCLTENGSVLCFGSDADGQLGQDCYWRHGDSSLKLISTFDKNSIKIQSVCCGFNHNLALSTYGRVYGWGDNKYGQCGVSDGANKENVFSPNPIYMGVDIVVKSIECGSDHSGLITMDNEVYLWGDNDFNQCCANVDNQEIENVFTPQNVTDYVLSKSKKDRIIKLYLGNSTTMFLLA